MGTGFNDITDLYEIYNVVQNSLIRYPKDLVIATMREFFEKDSQYRYVADEWGFPKTVDHTDLDTDAGINDDLCTRLYIGEAYRYDGIFYPAILVRSGGWRHVPISMNRDQHRVDYERTKYVDGYGNEIFVQVPSYFVLSGAWEGSLNIEVYTRGMRERDDLVALISLLFTDLSWNEAFKSGISIRQNVSVGAATEGEDRNDKLFKQTVTLELRTEWRREIPITNVVDIINICVDFVNLESDNIIVAPNITINNSVELLEAIQGL